jgi:hypothetical protein
LTILKIKIPTQHWQGSLRIERMGMFWEWEPLQASWEPSVGPEHLELACSSSLPHVKNHFGNFFCIWDGYDSFERHLMWMIPNKKQKKTNKTFCERGHLLLSRNFTKVKLNLNKTFTLFISTLFLLHMTHMHVFYPPLIFSIMENEAQHLDLSLQKFAIFLRTAWN